MKKTFPTENEMIDYIDESFKSDKDVVQVTSDYRDGEWIINYEMYDIQTKSSKM